MISSIKAYIKYTLDAIFWRLVNAFVRLEIAPPPQGTVLVIAPHPDDETFACGATISRLCAQGTNVHIAIISDGAGSTRAEGQTKSDLTAIRKKEARAATQALSLPQADVTFLGYQDGKLTEQKDKIAKDLSKIIERLSPSLIFAPHQQDANPDHHLIAKALESIHLPCLCYGYIVWAPTKKLLSCLLSIITHERQIRIPMKKYKERKLMAIDCYPSQTGGTSYRRGKGFLHPRFVKLFLKNDEIFFTAPTAH